MEWIKENAITILITMCGLIGGYTAWSVNENSYKVETTNQIHALQKDLDNAHGEIKQDQLELNQLEKASLVTQQQMLYIEKNEEKLQQSIDKLSESVTSLAVSLEHNTKK